MAVDLADQTALAQFTSELQKLIENNDFLRNGLDVVIAIGGTIAEWLQDPEVQRQIAIAAGAALLAAGVAEVPIIAAGFGRLGPIQGTLAPWLQSILYRGATPRAGWFAIMQRAGMTGSLRTVPAVGAAAAGIAAAVWQHLQTVEAARRFEADVRAIQGLRGPTKAKI